MAKKLLSKKSFNMSLSYVLLVLCVILVIAIIYMTVMYSKRCRESFDTISTTPSTPTPSYSKTPTPSYSKLNIDINNEHMFTRDLKYNLKIGDDETYISNTTNYPCLVINKNKGNGFYNYITLKTSINKYYDLFTDFTRKITLSFNKSTGRLLLSVLIGNEQDDPLSKLKGVWYMDPSTQGTPPYKLQFSSDSFYLLDSSKNQIGMSVNNNVTIDVVEENPSDVLNFMSLDMKNEPPVGLPYTTYEKEGGLNFIWELLNIRDNLRNENPFLQIVYTYDINSISYGYPTVHISKNLSTLSGILSYHDKFNLSYNKDTGNLYLSLYGGLDTLIEKKWYVVSYLMPKNDAPGTPPYTLKSDDSKFYLLDSSQKRIEYTNPINDITPVAVDFNSINGSTSNVIQLVYFDETKHFSPTTLNLIRTTFRPTTTTFRPTTTIRPFITIPKDKKIKLKLIISSVTGSPMIRLANFTNINATNIITNGSGYDIKNILTNKNITGTSWRSTHLNTTNYIQIETNDEWNRNKSFTITYYDANQYINYFTVTDDNIIYGYLKKTNKATLKNQKGITYNGYTYVYTNTI